MFEKIWNIAEGGINASGNIKTAKQLMIVAKAANADFIKWQKRDPRSSVPEEKQDQEKIVPWREEPTTYLQYKLDIEWNGSQYKELKDFAKGIELDMFSSAWDLSSAVFLANYDNVVKIPSAKINNLTLLDYCKNAFDLKIMSCGMSTEKEIEEAVSVLNPDVIMHTNSVYPTQVNDLNLKYIIWLREKYPKIYIGYSSHYYGITDAPMALSLGASWFEKHICLSHNDWGSDIKSSVEPHGYCKMVKTLVELNDGLKGYEERKLYPGEEKKRSDLRG
ncbi:MAG: N-acetylneuraminate synthase [Candidatus Lokiarchaeota archaeon]|nr:N-acetylneuraminate synthase [Candidatus Lokiarchaeota archaeon]